MKFVVSNQKLSPLDAIELCNRGDELVHQEMRTARSELLGIDGTTLASLDLGTDSFRSNLHLALLTGMASLLLTAKEFSLLDALYDLGRDENSRFFIDREVAQRINARDGRNYPNERANIYLSLIDLGFIERAKYPEDTKLFCYRLTTIGREALESGCIGIFKRLPNRHGPAKYIDDSGSLSEAAQKDLLGKSGTKT